MSLKQIVVLDDSSTGRLTQVKPNNSVNMLIHLFSLILFPTLIFCSQVQSKEKDSLTIFTEVSEKLEKYRSKPTPRNSKLVFKSVLELVNKEASTESAYESCEKVAMNMGARLQCFYPDAHVRYFAAGRIKNPERRKLQTKTF